MDPAVGFQILNFSVMPWWLLWIAAPRAGWSLRAASHGGVVVALAAIYLGLLAATLSMPSDAAGFAFDYETLRAALASPVGFLAGWTHYLAFDLFAGAWIVRESARIQVDPRIFLFFTLMAGPIGLGTFLVRRALRERSFGGIR